MKIRLYQERAVGAVFDAWAGCRSTLAVMPTGTGKTRVAAEVCRRDGDARFLFVAHREELIRQAAEHFAKVVGEPVGVEMAQERDGGRHRLTVASVQTLSRPARRDRLEGAYDRLIVDEAHHAAARSYREVLDFWPEAKVLGITATPRRAAQLAMGQVFESCCFDYEIGQAVEDGWLVPVRQYAVEVQGLDFSHLKTVAGDLSDAELETVLVREEVLHRMAVPALELAGDAPGIFFTTTVKHARLMEAVLNRYKPGCAKALWGETPRDERAEWVARYKSGRVQWLVNCGLFLEGFDAPHTAVVVMGRPTKSLALYTQVLGRGTRPLPGVVDGVPTPPAHAATIERMLADPGGRRVLWDYLQDHGAELARPRREAIAASAKPCCLVLDFVGNSGRHKIVSALDVLGGKYGDPVRRYAQQTIAEEGRGADTDEALERAAAELELLAEEDRRLKAVKAREALYRAREVDPLDGGSRAGLVGQESRDEPCTPKQAWLLHKRFNWDLAAARRLGKRQASAVIDKLMRGGGAA